MANIGPAAGSNPQTSVGNPNFNTGTPHQRDIDRFNLWKQVRAPPGVPFVPATMEELRDSFRLHNYVAPDPPVNQAPVRTQQPAQQLRAPVTTPAQQQFLDHTIPEFWLSGSNQAPNWKGKKILGQGGYAMVGLWQYEGPDIHVHPVIQIAVKETMPVVPPRIPANLREEAEMMKKIHKPIPSKHIVQLVKYPQFQNVQSANEGLGPEWDDKVRRIFTEYCPFGSLSQLIRNRIKT